MIDKNLVQEYIYILQIKASVIGCWTNFKLKYINIVKKKETGLSGPLSQWPMGW